MCNDDYEEDAAGPAWNFVTNCSTSSLALEALETPIDVRWDQHVTPEATVAEAPAPPRRPRPRGPSRSTSLKLEVMATCLLGNPLAAETASNKAEIAKLKARLEAERVVGKAAVEAKQSRVQRLKLELGRARSAHYAAVTMMERQSELLHAVNYGDASVVHAPHGLWQLARKMDARANRYNVPDMMVAWHVAKSVRSTVLAKALVALAVGAIANARIARAWIKLRSEPVVALTPEQSAAVRRLGWRLLGCIEKRISLSFRRWSVATSQQGAFARRGSLIALRKALMRPLAGRFAAWRAAVFRVLKQQNTFLQDEVHTLHGRLSALEVAVYRVNDVSSQDAHPVRRENSYRNIKSNLVRPETAGSLWVKERTSHPVVPNSDDHDSIEAKKLYQTTLRAKEQSLKQVSGPHVSSHDDAAEPAVDRRLERNNFCDHVGLLRKTNSDRPPKSDPSAWARRRSSSEALSRWQQAAWSRPDVATEAVARALGKFTRCDERPVRPRSAPPRRPSHHQQRRQALDGRQAVDKLADRVELELSIRALSPPDG